MSVIDSICYLVIESGYDGEKMNSNQKSLNDLLETFDRRTG